MTARTAALFAALLLAAPAARAAATAAAPASAPPAASQAAALPAGIGVAPFRMDYRLLHGSWSIGVATFTLARDGGHWLFRWEAHPTGLAAVFVHSTYSEASRFTIVDRRLRPLAYSYSDSGHADRDETIDFDWAAGRALDTNDGNKKTFDLRAGLLDRLSSQLALSRRLAAGLPLPVTYHVINGGRLRTYTLKRIRKESVTTPAGRFDTVVVERSDSTSDKTLVFWLAPKYAWLPVRLEQREPGETTDTSVLTGLEWLKAPPPAARSASADAHVREP